MLASGVALASDEAPNPQRRFDNIHTIDFAGVVDPMLRAYLMRRVDDAIQDGADCIVFRIDSPGGQMGEMREIGDRIFRIPDKVHTVAWIPRMALSAAAFVSLACDEIVLGAEASLGDSQPIVATPDGKPQRIGEKIESPARAWFRNYAQANGYPVLLAAAMVSVEQEVLRVRHESTGDVFFVDGKTFRDAEPDDVVVEEKNLRRDDLVQVGEAVVNSEQLLTMTPEEAADFGFVKRRFADGGSVPADESALLDAIKTPNAKITNWKMNFSEHAGRFLLGVAGVLSALVVVAVMVTLWQGPGTMTIVGIAALVISLIIYGTVEHLHGFPLFLLALGAVLLVAEVFLIPGFGVFGLLGIVSMAIGFLFLAAGTTIGDDTKQLTQEGVVQFGLQFVVTAILGFVLLFTMSRFFPKVGPARRMVLTGPEGATVGVHDAWLPGVGDAGTTLSNLRPVGTARFGDEEVSVVSIEGFLAKGVPVTVVQIEGTEVRVQAEEDTAS